MPAPAHKFTRRRFIADSAALAAGTVVGPRLTSQLEAQSPETSGEFRNNWQRCPSRIWLGAEFWLNPLQDWQILDGRIECTNAASDRNVHVLVRELGRVNEKGLYKTGSQCTALKDDTTNREGRDVGAVRGSARGDQRSAGSAGGVDGTRVSGGGVVSGTQRHTVAGSARRVWRVERGVYALPPVGRCWSVAGPMGGAATLRRFPGCRRALCEKFCGW